MSYVQRGSADIWKENIMEDLERRLLNYEVVKEFLTDLKEEFGRGDEKVNKVAELRRLKQEEKTMEKFMQKFRRVARDSGYEGRLLIKEFKCGMNGTIRQRLIKLEC